MQISLGTDFALRTLMALSAGDKQLSVDWIASHYGISRNHLAKVAQRLQQEGYVIGTRGRAGGIALAMPAENINIGKVVREFETLTNFVQCNGPDGTCAITTACGLKPVFHKALEAFMAVLDQYSLADISANKFGIWRALTGEDMDMPIPA